MRAKDKNRRRGVFPSFVEARQPRTSSVTSKGWELMNVIQTIAGHQWMTVNKREWKKTLKSSVTYFRFERIDDNEDKI